MPPTEPPSNAVRSLSRDQQTVRAAAPTALRLCRPTTASLARVEPGQRAGLVELPNGAREHRRVPSVRPGVAGAQLRNRGARQRQTGPPSPMSPKVGETVGLHQNAAKIMRHPQRDAIARPSIALARLQ